MQALLNFIPEAPIFVAASELIQIQSTGPFIQRADLVEVLKDYFSGNLDEPALPEIICQDLRGWHSNSLWAFTDSAQITRILNQLQPHHREIIFYYFSEKCNLAVLESYYCHSFVGKENFFEFLDIELRNALDTLSENILREL